MTRTQPGWDGIVLAGAPGSGKRTTAFALTALARRYARFPALCSARVSALDIEYATDRHIAELRSWAQIFHEVTRDGALHIHDSERLCRIRDEGRTPVVTVDAVGCLDAFAGGPRPWLTVLLHGRTDRPSAVLRRRTARELERLGRRCVLAVRTDLLSVGAVSQLIDRAVRDGP